MTELKDRLQTALGGTYTFERELGGGGMSRVFVADEVALGRKVVVKVLRGNVAEGVSAERFAREISMAARLQQANIVPLLSTGQANGLPFYTMPFVEGQSLRDRLERDGPPSIAATINILRDVARALAYAHEKGVVHRDIKPENILLSGDAAVVTDFGIAKAIRAAREEHGDALTQTGTSIGTPIYMAPEQAAGDAETDHRADLYSFGCVAYELLAGHPPFHGLAPRQLFRAHLLDPPVPIETLRPDVPPALAALVMQCLGKEPHDRPQSAREVLTALETAGHVRTSAPQPAFAGPVATPGAPVTTVGIVPAPPRRLARWALLALAVGGAGALATFLAMRPRSAERPASPLIAVLPFAPASGDSTTQYLADGTADELAIALGKLPGVRLAARTASYHYRGRRDVDLREVGRALGVKYVVTGTVAHAGPDVKVAVHLSPTNGGPEVWSDSFVRVASDVLRIQDDVARATSEQIGTLLAIATPSTSARESARGTTDAEAYDLYLRGQDLLRRRAVREARNVFERAIARDSGFARAYAGLSEAYAFHPQFTGTPATVVYDPGTAAANRALAIDSTVAQAHMALGILYMNAFKWDQAGLHFRRAVELDPDDAAARLQLGRFLVHTGRLREARTEIERAKHLDPFSGVITAWAGYILYQSGKLPEAVAECARAFQLDSTNAIVLAISSFVNVGAHHDDVALRYADRQPDAPAFNGYTAYIHAAVGDGARTRAIIGRLEARTPRPWFGEMAIAMGYLGLRDTSRALAALERSTVMRDAWTSYVPLCDPMYDPVRSSARFALLLQQVGLDQRVFVYPAGGRCGGAF